MYFFVKFFLADIDGVDGVCTSSSSNEENEIVIRSRPYYRSGDLPVDRRAYGDQLPDLVTSSSSGVLRSSDMTASLRPARDKDNELRIARRLAQIGDEYEREFFSSVSGKKNSRYFLIINKNN